MPGIWHWILISLVALTASSLAGVTGFGGAAVLLPALVAAFGVREAIPILTVAQLIGNGSRAWFNRRELDWRVVALFAIRGGATAVLGGPLLSQTPPAGLTRRLGATLLLRVGSRH